MSMCVVYMFNTDYQYFLENKCNECSYLYKYNII